MQERKQTTKYLWPVAFAVILIFSLMTGIFFTRNSLMKLTVEERSYQLEEMVTQIKANLDNGLQTHWNLVAGLNNAVQGKHFTDSQKLCESISSLEQIFCTDRSNERIL